MTALDIRYVFLMVTLSTLGTSYMVYVAWQTEVARHAKAYVRLADRLRESNDQIYDMRRADVYRDLGICREKLYDAELLSETTYGVRHELEACSLALEASTYEIVELRSECGYRR